MEINNDRELAGAVAKADELIQAIQDYTQREYKKDAKIRFPRGFIRTASELRRKTPFIRDRTLKTNISYMLMLSDVVHWLLIRTDIFGTAKAMLIKLFIFIGGQIAESLTKDYLAGVCAKSKGYKDRTQRLLDDGIINEELKTDMDWLWDVRNNIHLFMLNEREHESDDYSTYSQIRAAKSIRALIDALSADAVRPLGN